MGRRIGTGWAFVPGISFFLVDSRRRGGVYRLTQEAFSLLATKQLLNALRTLGSGFGGFLASSGLRQLSAVLTSSPTPLPLPAIPAHPAQA